LARYDKYEPYAGGFRAALAADFGTLTNAADLGKIWGVGLDTNGRVVKGAGNTGIVGVLILTMEKYALNVVDVMTDGEIVDILATTPFDGFAAASVAGTKYYADATTGGITTVNTLNYAIGWTVERSRLVVRTGNRAVAA
jgi:hypothetical protein